MTTTATNGINSLNLSQTGSLLKNSYSQQIQQQLQQNILLYVYLGNQQQKQYEGQQHPPITYILPDGRYVSKAQFEAIYKLGNDILTNLPIDEADCYYLTPAQYLCARTAIEGLALLTQRYENGDMFKGYYWRGIPIVEVTNG